MSNYRNFKTKNRTHQKGFNGLSKTVATIGSILGLITASITIMNALDNNKNTKKRTYDKPDDNHCQRNSKGIPSGKH